MNLFISKKVIVIYSVKSSLFLIFLSLNSFAQDDLVSFCFEKKVSLSEAAKNLDFLLLPTEKIALRPGDHCLDVLTSPHRTKLLEKFLSKRYNIISETGVSGPSEIEHCRIDFKTLSNKKIETNNASLGKVTNLGTSEQSRTEVSSAQLLLASGKQGSIEVYGRSLDIECKKGASGFYQLAFFFRDQAGNSARSEITVRESELVNVGSIVKELDEKNKTLGLPTSNVSETKGYENINYELKIEK